MATCGQSKYMAHMRAKATSKPSAAMSNHEAMEHKAKTNDQKGKVGGDCNRTQCQRPNAWWYNKTMNAFYCADCAGAINESCLYKDHIVSFGSKVYVMPPTIKTEEVGGRWLVSLITAANPEGVGKYTCHDTKEEADEGFLEMAHYAGLRGDGSPPFHYSELREKMLRMRTLIQERYPDQEMVPFD